MAAPIPCASKRHTDMFYPAAKAPAKVADVPEVKAEESADKPRRDR